MRIFAKVEAGCHLNFFQKFCPPFQYRPNYTDGNIPKYFHHFS